jgi:hypothetical protein
LIHKAYMVFHEIAAAILQGPHGTWAGQPDRKF